MGELCRRDQDGVSAEVAMQRRVPLNERIAIVNKFIELFEARKQEFGEQLTTEMGRPIRYALGEMGGFLERARYMVSVAEERLKDYAVPDAANKPGFKLSIRREPMGVCALISAWNVG